MALPSTGSSTSRSNGLIPGVTRCRSMLQCTIKAYGSTKEVRLSSDQKPDMEFVNIVTQNVVHLQRYYSKLQFALYPGQLDFYPTTGSCGSDKYEHWQVKSSVHFCETQSTTNPRAE